MPGINYYELQEVDKDGRSVYSDIVHVRVADKNEYRIYPNPAQGKINICLTGKDNRIITIELFDATGKISLSKQSGITEGTNTIELNIAALAKGTYFLQIKNMDVPVMKMIKE